MYLSFLAKIIIHENGEILKSYLELGVENLKTFCSMDKIY